ncbi:hypothetical protein [Pseudomonas sp. R19M]|uniref:hypothetical protein n=1 Tax=Pseudomonas sp. R19M TaxID=3158964 RepID=UPI003A317F38
MNIDAEDGVDFSPEKSLFHKTPQNFAGHTGSHTLWLPPAFMHSVDLFEWRE